MTNIADISCVIIAKDAAMSIAPVLDSLTSFNDVVLYLNNTTDTTKKIATEYDNVTIIEGDFLGFGPTKNRAASYAKNDWVLSLDADEVLSSAFVSALKEQKLEQNTLYTILRINYYKTQEIKHCWGDDTIIRLYNRESDAFTDAKVHEKILQNNSKIIALKGVVKHYPYSSVTDFIVKLDRYSTIFAEDNVGKKSSSPSKALFNGIFSFCKTYFLKRGFLDGHAGLIIAFSHMATNFYKYIKLYEQNKELKSQ